jgi:uncharacterized membrane protein
MSYEVLLTVHVAAAVLWVGGGISTILMAFRMKRAGSGSEMAAFAKNIEWLGKFYYTPLSLVALIFGILLVRQMESVTVSDFFVQYGLTGIVLTIAIGAGFLGPQSGRLGKLIDEKGFGAPEVQRLLARILLVARIDSAMLFSVVLVMALKPFS